MADSWADSTWEPEKKRVTKNLGWEIADLSRKFYIS